jgi:hypothetical protein
MNTVYSTKPQQMLEISPLDALWSLYKSQTKRVRDAFRKRLLAESVSDKHAAAMKTYESQLPSKVRKSVSMMAESIKRSVDEVRNASVTKSHVGRPAEDFLAELESEES